MQTTASYDDWKCDPSPEATPSLRASRVLTLWLDRQDGETWIDRRPDRSGHDYPSEVWQVTVDLSRDSAGEVEAVATAIGLDVWLCHCDGPLSVDLSDREQLATLAEAAAANICMDRADELLEDYGC